MKRGTVKISRFWFTPLFSCHFGPETCNKLSFFHTSFVPKEHCIYHIHIWAILVTFLVFIMYLPNKARLGKRSDFVHGLLSAAGHKNWESLCYLDLTPFSQYLVQRDTFIYLAPLPEGPRFNGPLAYGLCILEKWTGLHHYS